MTYSVQTSNSSLLLFLIKRKLFIYKPFDFKAITPKRGTRVRAPEIYVRGSVEYNQ